MRIIDNRLVQMNKYLCDKFEKLNDIVFYDVEASSLNKNSFPLQFGYVGSDLVEHSLYIKPLPHWRREDMDPTSSAIHNITWSFLNEFGRDGREVAERCNLKFQGKEILSDALRYDAMWTSRLYEDLRVKPLFLLDTYEYFPDLLKTSLHPDFANNYGRYEEASAFLFPHTHKAEEDALHMAVFTRCWISKEWGELVVQIANEKRGVEAA